METDILLYLKMHHRDEVVSFLKRLWSEQYTICPICKNGTLEHLHKKAKKSNSDWKCPTCGEIYHLIKILDKLNERE